MAAGSGPAAPARFLAEHAGRCGDAGTSVRSAAPGRGQCARRQRAVHHRRSADIGAEGAEPARTGDAVHDLARCVPGAAAPMERPGRHCRGRADRGTKPTGAGRADRLFHQHAGAARRSVGQSLVRRISCRACASARSMRTRIRTCHSKSWSRNLPPGATFRATPCFRYPSRCRTRRRRIGDCPAWRSSRSGVSSTTTRNSISILR